MEEPKPEEDLEVSDDQANRESSENVSLIQKIKHILSQVTVEPVVFFHYLAFAITLVSQNQMIVYKTCRGLNFANNNHLLVTRLFLRSLKFLGLQQKFYQR